MTAAIRKLLHGALTTASLLLVAEGPACAETDWRQVGYFGSDGGNVSVGSARVRVITVPDIPSDLFESGMRADTVEIAKLYPGWDYRGNLEVHYALTPQGYRQDSFRYSIGAERTALPDDPVKASLALFDLKGERRAQIPWDLHELIGANVPIVAAATANLDADLDSEWVVVVAGPWMEAERGARMKLSLVDRRGSQWDLIAVFTLTEPRRAGPLEVRDATGDGRPDVVFRTFHESAGHFWVEVRIFSAHNGLPSVLNPARFNPAGAPARD